MKRRRDEETERLRDGETNAGLRPRVAYKAPPGGFGGREGTAGPAATPWLIIYTTKDHKNRTELYKG